MTDDDRLPRSDFVRDRMQPDFYLTHAIWRNTYGSFQPETGVRKVIDGMPQREGFRLVEHGCPDFDLAERVILRGLRKDWDTLRIARLIEWLHKRQQRAAIRGYAHLPTVCTVHDASAALHRV